MPRRRRHPGPTVDEAKVAAAAVAASRLVAKAVAKEAEQPLVLPEQKRLSKGEIEILLRALRANLKPAKTAILGLEPKLRAAFEVELNTYYPLRTDPLWAEAFSEVVEQYKLSQAKVEARCDELGIPSRFRPSIRQPTWEMGGLNTIKELRADMRRTAYAQIKDLVQERVEEHERKAANAQLEIFAHGCITPLAQEFFDRLPKIDDLIKPISAKEVYNLLEGKAPERVNSWERDRLPEYQPDLGKGEEADDFNAD